MSITLEQVKKVALLARLRLSPGELETMTAQLGQILDYMELLSELATDDVEPMTHAIDLANVFRDDEVRPSLQRREALAGAPHHDDECYRVPAVLGE